MPLPRKASRMGRPPVPEKDKLKICVRADLDAATDRALNAEMMASGQTRSKVIRRLVREQLRALGHNVPITADEKREDQE